MKTRPGPLKVAIRTDEKAGVVRAFFSSLDDCEREEVATLDLSLASIPGVMQAWVSMLAASLHAVLEAAGLTPVGVEVVDRGSAQEN